MITPEWKSPRKVAEEIRDYQRDRFESYMRLVDDGTLERELGIAALRDELESGLWEPHGTQTTIDNNQVA